LISIVYKEVTPHLEDCIFIKVFSYKLLALKFSSFVFESVTV